MRRWRIFASLLRHSCGSKTLESPLFDNFLAQDQRSNRRQGQPDRGGLSRLKGRASVRSQSSRRRGPTLPRRLSPFQSTCPPPPASPCRPAIRGDGFPWRGAPGRPWWPTLGASREDLGRIVRPPRERVRKIRWNFRSGRGAARKGRPMADATGGAFLRHFASLLWPKRRRNRRFSSPFWPKIGGRIAKVAKKPAVAKAYAESADATKV